MIGQWFGSSEHASGLFLVLGSVALFPGLIMFWLRWIRSGRRDNVPPSLAHFVWERSFVMAAVVLAVIGFELFDSVLQNTAGGLLARAGATAYLFGGILGVAAEALNLKPGQETYALVVIYVVLAFLGQAAIGGALLLSGLLAPWLGWVAVIWNIAWLVALLVISPRDIDYPVLQHFAPLLIGIALLMK